jgi:hypothetical protein
VKHNCGLVAGHVRGDRLAPGDAADKGLLKLLDDTGAVLVTSWMKVSARTLARTRAGVYRSAILERSKSGRAYRPSGGSRAWQSRGTRLAAGSGA